MGVSVIIPLYNKAETIARAIDSVLAQDVETEILVVDDGSTDGSPLVAETYGGAVKCIRQENMGPSTARNRGAQMSRFPYLVFLDADDELLPGCLAAHLECRQFRPEVQTTISPSKKFLKRIIDNPDGFTHEGDVYFSSRFMFQLVSGIHISWLCVDRDLFNAVAGFDSELRCWEISDFLYRLLLKSPVAGFLGTTYVVLHKDPDNSQFQRTRRDATFRSYYLNKMIDRIHEAPADQRRLVVLKAKQSLKDLMAAGAVTEFRSALRRLVLLSGGEASLWSLRMLSLLPDFLIRGGLAVWGCWSSFQRLPSSRS